MAKKKVNVKFLITLTAVIGGLSLVGFVSVLAMYSRHTSAAFIKKAADEEKKGNLPLAALYLGVAANKDLNNKSLFMQSGDMYERAVAIDPVYMGKATQEYRQVLELDPSYQPAIEHLLGIAVAQLHDGAASPEFFAELKRLADQAASSDKSNPTYQVYSYVASLEQWSYSAARANPLIEKQIQELSRIAEQNPQIADGAFYASKAQLRIARDLRYDGQVDRYHQILDAVLARHKAAVAARPHDPAVQWRGAQIFGNLKGSDDRADLKATCDQLTKDAVTSARDAVKPADPVYTDVQASYVQWLKEQGASQDQLEKVYRDWSAAQPSDVRARNELANFLGSIPAKRTEAMAILTKSVQPDPQAKGYAILRTRNNQRGTLILLNSLRAQDASLVQGKSRDPLLSAIDDDLAKIASMGSAEDPMYLKLRGKSQMLHGNTVEAIKSYERASSALGNQIDFDLWSQLQNAYLLTGQTGTAQRMMEDLLAKFPGYTELRVKLAALYLNTGELDKAAAHLKYAQANPPKDPALAKQLDEVALVLALREKDTPAARQQIAPLPESTPAQVKYKAAMYNQAGELSNAVRLYQTVLQTDPADPEAVGAMVELLMQQKDRPGALAIVQAALKTKPDSRAFQELLDRLSVETPDGYRKYQDALAEKITDPMIRNLRKAVLSMQRGDFESAQKQLDAADAIAQNDQRSILLHIELYVLQGMFDQAREWVERAAKYNVDRMDGLAIRTQFAINKKEPVDALKWGNQLVGKYGEFASNWSLLGQAQEMAGQYPEALASFNQALQRQSNNIDALKGRIACLEATGEYADEKSTIETAMRLAPKDLKLRDLNLNWQLHHGDPDLVVKACEEILKVEPENAAVYAALGQAAVATAQSKYAGDPSAALRLLTEAKEVLRAGMMKFGATPDVLGLYGPMATTLDTLGDPSAAEEVLRQFVAHPLMKAKPDALREMAHFYERHGRTANEEQALRDAYARSNQSVDIELDLAQFLLRQNRGDEAMKLLADVNASNPRIQNQRIEALLAAKRIDEAQAMTVSIFGATPTTAIGFFYRGLIHISREQVADSINDFSMARDKDSRNPVIQLWLARALFKAGRNDQAASQLEDILRRNPLRDDARSLLLDNYESGDSPQWSDFDRVIKDALAHPSMKVNPIWHRRFARSLSRRGQFGLARQEIAAARALAPNSMPLQDEFVNILVQAKDWPAVLSETDQQLAAGYKEPFVYGKRGVARAATGDKPNALKEFDTAITGYQAAKNSEGVADVVRTMAQVLSPAEAQARLPQIMDPGSRAIVQVDLYGLQDDRANQAKAAELALADKTHLTVEQRATLLRTAADAYLITKEWVGARRSLEELVKVRPDDVTSLNDLAYLIATILNAPNDAKPYSRRAYELARHSSNRSIIDTHGWVLTQCGGRDDLIQAVDILRNLVDSNQDFTVARYHLAVAYLRQGGWQRAGEELAKVQQQMQQLEQKHQPVPDELKVGVPKAVQEVRQKSGQANGTAGR
ncbi:MAG TPA: tetratricopeptide repeat protein [Tepidisphaeraceae bacterium]|jgi:tetratricopeptide (TPR) repeat protein